ncbi:hypothetical protein AK812_SmicGene37079 [Symbiodinium microadriaticum]|uniref:Uncharacterized protein n=1 Tax=Symbiodinium microadriaticum TaxID=2951 RepID=A0A1Q9CHG9_SYMMI|nr:hypothetical protein AK812_SmicGene37079 [Symbiodinium microadriaticum]
MSEDVTRTGQRAAAQRVFAGFSEKPEKWKKRKKPFAAANSELEVLSVDELQKLLLLKDQALQLLQEEVEELQSSLRSQELMEVRYRHLQALVV